jgi:cytochrome b subunit of formate dehydrogenase
MYPFLSSINTYVSVFAWPMTIVSALIMYRQWAASLMWGRVIPTIVFLVALVGLIAELDSRGYFDRYWQSNLTTISDKTFTNTEVMLDGNNFSHCHFNNVTFIINGARFGFSYNDVHGSRFRSDNNYVQTAFFIMAKLGVLTIPVLTKAVT